MPGKAKAGIFYGSTAGNTERVAGMIMSRLNPWFITGLHDIAGASASIMETYDLLVLGTSTWGLGTLQEDWERWLVKSGKVELKSKPIAFFGLGDQDSYPETFADGLGILYERIIRQDMKHIGRWSGSGYHFESSRAFYQNVFIGLVLDEDNQQDLTSGRIDAWVEQLVREYRNISEEGQAGKNGL